MSDPKGPGASEMQPHSRRTTPGPLSSRSARLGSAKSDSEAPPSVNFDDEDFLYHLYRGSELLQDNLMPEAKEELERALRLQPQDVEGQGLLGVVYFRLGLYPRAIEIYEEIIRACPNEVSPRVTLALCYLKTGQSAPARDALEEVLRRVPDHVRAWGYLGLIFERLGDYPKAEAAFERAAQPNLARRMQRLIAEQARVPEAPPPPDEAPERAEVRAAAADAVQELDANAGDSPFSHASNQHPSDPSRSGRWRAVEPGEASVPPMPKARRAPSLVGRLGPAVPAISDPSELARDSVPPPASLRAQASLPPPPPAATTELLGGPGALTFPEPPQRVL